METTVHEFQALMEEFGMKTYSALARVVGLTCQQMMARKDKDGNPRYDKLEAICLAQRSDLTLREIFEKAAPYVRVPGEKKAAKTVWPEANVGDRVVKLNRKGVPVIRGVVESKNEYFINVRQDGENGALVGVTTSQRILIPEATYLEWQIEAEALVEAA